MGYKFNPFTNNFDITGAAGTSSTSPGGTNTQVQFNNSGSFAGDSGLTFASATDILTVVGGVSVTGSAGQETVVNESGVDADFRIEGDNTVNLLKIDASTDRVGVNTGTPSSRVTIYNDSTLSNNALEIIQDNGSGTGAAALIKNFTNFAHGGDLVVVQMVNATDSGKVLKLDNNGTGVTFETTDATNTQIQFSKDGGAIFNEEGNNVNFRVESDTSTHMIFVDGANNRVGVNCDTPDETLDVIGNFQVADSAGTAVTKSYRFKTNGGALDLDASGKNLYVSVYSAASYGGTQRKYLILKSDNHIAQALGAWEYKANNNEFGDTFAWIGEDKFVYNESAANIDFRVEGTSDQNLIFVDASADSVAIGASDPAAKLDVNGDSVRIRTSQTPGSTGATGVAGEIAWDANYIYVCTATNTWKRSALGTF